MRFGFRKTRKREGTLRKAAAVQSVPTLSQDALANIKDAAFETLHADPQWQECRALVKVSLDPPGLVVVFDHSEAPGLFVTADAAETGQAETLQADAKRKVAELVERVTSDLIAGRHSPRARD